ncbi:Hypothetical predicted protein [Marmota monax]|uniref:Guanine nucleotide-binding protein subunit gamma n=2 Tax=Amniota TaxID=32524 RepID=A0A5E4BK23_MARMO|nr:Hypothetical predicted protein [Marmota monax]
MAGQRDALGGGSGLTGPPGSATLRLLGQRVPAPSPAGPHRPTSCLWILLSWTLLSLGHTCGLCVWLSLSARSTGPSLQLPPGPCGWLPGVVARPCAGPDRPSLLPTQVSKASSELMSYCEQHARSDPLLVGVPASENPFKDKKPCTIL